MNFIWSGLFWGIILVLLGLSVILKSLLNIDIPVFKIVFAVILIYLGIRILTGSSLKTKNTIIFNRTRLSSQTDKDEVNIIFGSGLVDLRDLVDLKENTNREINIIFGSGRVILPENTSLLIKSDTVFGESRFPDGKTDFFGEYKYKNKFEEDGPTLFLEINVVFGSLVVEE